MKKTFFIILTLIICVFTFAKAPKAALAASCSIVGPSSLIEGETGTWTAVDACSWPLTRCNDIGLCSVCSVPIGQSCPPSGTLTSTFSFSPPIGNYYIWWNGGYINTSSPCFNFEDNYATSCTTTYTVNPAPTVPPIPTPVPLPDLTINMETGCGQSLPQGMAALFSTRVSNLSPNPAATSTTAFNVDGSGNGQLQNISVYPGTQIWSWDTAPLSIGSHTIDTWANFWEVWDGTGIDESSLLNNYSTCTFNVTAPPTPTPTPTPPPPASPPVINSLTINGISAQNGGISGRLSTEGGSNIQNPININVNASAGSGLIRDFKIDFSPGFSIAYSPQSGGNCSTGNYCVLDGSWQSIITPPGFRDVPSGCNPNPPSTCSYRVTAGSSDNSTFASWIVTFYSSFGSRSNMTTSATVTNTNGLPTSRTF